MRDSPDWFWSTYGDEADRPGEWWRRFIEEGAWFVARNGERPVGIAAAIGRADRDDIEWQLISMWVAEEARGHGIGTRLVEAVKSWARSTGAEALHLDVTDGNESARRLYERCGFRATGRTTPHPRRPDLREHEMLAPLSPGSSPPED